MNARKFGFGGGAFGMKGGSHISTQPAALNLTPMIDMLTVMIIFLVKSYSTSPQYLMPSQKIDLSITTSEMPAPDKPYLLVGKDGVFVDGKMVVPFKNGTPVEGSVDKASGAMPELQRTLEAMAKKAQFIAKANSKVEFTGTLILQTDKSIPFSALKPVFKTAGLAGYYDFKFAALHPN